MSSSDRPSTVTIQPTTAFDDLPLFGDLPVIGQVPDHPAIIDFVERTIALTTPAAVRYCDGSQEEYEELVDLLVDGGGAIRLNEALHPQSLLVRTDPDDVARVEDSTFICSVSESDAGPINNWMHPDQMKGILTRLFEGCMEGRTLYVIPFCMGPVDDPRAKFGVEITDSPYVVASMRIMTRMGAEPLQAMVDRQADFVPALHSVGMPLPPGVEDVPWPCSDTKYIVHFPEERSIWSYGSGYGGNSLLGKKCYALRIASVMGRDEGWLAEHMLILKLTSPAGSVHHLCAAFPSACGKTNLAMLEPTLDGWTVETLGDDIAWLRIGDDGRLYAINPENGFFGVAPGTSYQTNPNAMRTLAPGNTIYTNVALTDEGGVWWEGMTPEPPTHLVDWKGRSWTPQVGPEGGRRDEPAAHPNSRFCTPIRQCPILSPDVDLPTGVPIDMIVFGGRRQNTIPLVTESTSWTHGVFMGATCSSETTAAATGAVGVLRRDPMAMLPFIGYHVGDYISHWLSMADRTLESALPRVFYVNWFRKDAEGRFIWPGFGDNARVLAWMVARLEGHVDALDTPIGRIPRPQDLDITGLDLTDEQVDAVTCYAVNEWYDELPRLRLWLTGLGEKVPKPLWWELERLAWEVSTDPTRRRY